MLVPYPQIRQSLLIVLLSLVVAVPSAAAATQDATYMFRPHCSRGYDYDNNNDTVFGRLPSNEELIDLGDGWEGCSFFETEDPQTLRTKELRMGDILNFDVVIKNPSKQNIAYAAAQLTYDPNVLEGVSIDISRFFPEVDPGGSDFLEDVGEISISASATEGDEPGDFWIPVAKIQMKLIKEIPTGTVISFSDVQAGGNTEIIAADDDYVIGEEPGSLLVRAAQIVSNENDNSCSTNEDCESGVCTDNSCQPLKNAAGDACSTNDECENGFCFESICRGTGFKIPDGGACERDNQCLSLLCVDLICASASDLENGQSCTANDECASGNCSNGSCQDADTTEEQNSSDNNQSTNFVQDIPDEESSTNGISKNSNGEECSTNSNCNSGSCIEGICRDRENPQIPDGEGCQLSVQCQSGLCTEGICREKQTFGVERTAFGLLQVQNLRVTTDAGTAYLAWDALESSSLKGYNIYYGTTSSQYIQRKTVNESTTNLSIRNLPDGNRYYFAVRGVSNEDEESAFSEEQSVIIGNPESSTSPLVASAFLDQQAPTNPLAGNTTDSVDVVPGETGATSSLVIILIVLASASTLIFARKLS